MGQNKQDSDRSRPQFLQIRNLGPGDRIYKWTTQTRATFCQRINRLHDTSMGRLVQPVDPVEHLIDDIHLHSSATTRQV
jgi:hypothetical protein